MEVLNNSHNYSYPKKASGTDQSSSKKGEEAQWIQRTEQLLPEAQPKDEREGPESDSWLTKINTEIQNLIAALEESNAKDSLTDDRTRVVSQEILTQLNKKFLLLETCDMEVKEEINDASELEAVYSEILNSFEDLFGKNKTTSLRKKLYEDNEFPRSTKQAFIVYSAVLDNILAGTEENERFYQGAFDILAHLVQKSTFVSMLLLLDCHKLLKHRQIESIFSLFVELRSKCLKILENQQIKANCFEQLNLIQLENLLSLINSLQESSTEEFQAFFKNNKLNEHAISLFSETVYTQETWFKLQDAFQTITSDSHSEERLMTTLLEELSVSTEWEESCRLISSLIKGNLEVTSKSFEFISDLANLEEKRKGIKLDLPPKYELSSNPIFTEDQKFSGTNFEPIDGQRNRLFTESIASFTFKSKKSKIGVLFSLLFYSKLNETSFLIELITEESMEADLKDVLTDCNSEILFNLLLNSALNYLNFDQSSLGSDFASKLVNKVLCLLRIILLEDEKPKSRSEFECFTAKRFPIKIKAGNRNIEFRATLMEILQSLLSNIVFRPKSQALPRSSEISIYLATFIELSFDICFSENIELFVHFFAQRSILSRQTRDEVIPEISAFFYRLYSNPMLEDSHFNQLEKLISEEELLRDMLNLASKDFIGLDLQPGCIFPYLHNEYFHCDLYSEATFERAFAAYSHLRYKRNNNLSSFRAEICEIASFLQSITKKVEIEVKNKVEAIYFPLNPRVSSILESIIFRYARRASGNCSFTEKDLHEGGTYLYEQITQNESNSSLTSYYFISCQITIYLLALISIAFLLFYRLDSKEVEEHYTSLRWILSVQILVAIGTIKSLWHYFRSKESEGKFERLHKGNASGWQVTWISLLLCAAIVAVSDPFCAPAISFQIFAFLIYFEDRYLMFEMLSAKFVIPSSLIIIFLWFFFNLSIGFNLLGSTSSALIGFAVGAIMGLTAVARRQGRIPEERIAKDCYTLNYVHLFTRVNETSLKRNWFEVLIKGGSIVWMIVE